MISGQAEPSASVAVVGAGAWGTSLACTLADRFRQVRLWVFEADLAEEMARTRENSVYLSGVPLPPAVTPMSSLERVLSDQAFVILVVPSHVFRRVLEMAHPHLQADAVVVSATKGIETESLCTMTQVMQGTLPSVYHPKLAVLSGPSFAREVALRLPTAVVAAAADPKVARVVQRTVSGGPIRVYAGTDPLGVELGGAVKNVIAIAAGIEDGLGLGTNARAALITRGLAEMTRLGTAMGAQAATFAGLSGMGDLILTCTGDLSRNRTLGKRIAAGASLSDAQGGSRSVAEGVNTCRSVVRLADRHGIEMPICRAVHRVLFDGQDPRAAVVGLMTRELRFEGD